jgi:hypothetical protein
MKAQVPKVALQELGVSPLPAPAVALYKAPARRAPVRMIEGEPAEAASRLVRILRDEARVI